MSEGCNEPDAPLPSLVAFVALRRWSETGRVDVSFPAVACRKISRAPESFRANQRETGRQSSSGKRGGWRAVDVGDRVRAYPDPRQSS